MAIILSIETATTVCSVALSKDGSVIGSREINEGFVHAEKLTVFIQEILKEAQLEAAQLSAVAVSSGPGSYTGLRIGASVAKGLCYALDLPLISVPTLEAMALGAISLYPNDAFYCPMIDARRMEVYCALFDAELNIISPVEAKIIDAGFMSGFSRPIICFGDGSDKAKTLPEIKHQFVECLPSAANVSVLAEKKFAMNAFENVSLFEPFYLKEFVAGPKKGSG